MFNETEGTKYAKSYYNNDVPFVKCSKCTMSFQRGAISRWFQ